MESLSIKPRLPSQTARIQVLHRMQSRTIWFWFCAFTFVSSVSWVYQQLSFAGSLSLGMPIPDAINISDTFDNLLKVDGLNDEANQFVGVSILYGWTWMTHPALCFLVNFALMIWATILYYKYFIKKLGVPAWSIAGVLANPYIVLAMIGPNKEIPLLVLTLLYFRAVTEQKSHWLLTASITSLFAYFFRDGYGAFLAISLLILIVLKFRPKPFAISIFIGCITIAAFFGVLRSISAILERNVESFEGIDRGYAAVGGFAALINLDHLSIVGGVVMFCLRTLYNLLTLAVFPVFQTTGGIYWLGVAYWVFGVIILACMLSCITALRTWKLNRSPLLLAAAFTIGTLFMISLSLFVQPRYLMPILPLAMAVLACSNARTRRNSLIVALLVPSIVILAYWFTGSAPPIREPDDFEAPAYIV